MKKILASLCALALLCGCSSAAKTIDTEAIGTGISSIEDAPAMMELSADNISDYLSLSTEDYSKAVCFMPLMNVTATEVMLFTYETDAQKTSIQKALDKRLSELENTWSQYLPDQYDLVKNRTSVDENHMYGYIIGEEAFVTEVKDLITANTK